MIKNLEDAIINFIKAMLPYKSEMAEKEKAALKMKEIHKKTKKLLTDKIDGFVLMFEDRNPGFYKEYRDLRQDHHYKHVKETINQETDFHDLLHVENEIDEAKPKPKPKNRQKANPETI